MSIMYVLCEQVVVVGGGYIGMEVSSGLNKNGLDVTMVFPEPFMMPRLFTEEIASFYEDFLAGKGITLIKGNTAKSFKGENGKVGRCLCPIGLCNAHIAQLADHTAALSTSAGCPLAEH